MAIITLRLSTVNVQPSDRPLACRYCGHGVLQKWGAVTKPVRDSQIHQVWVHRYYCTQCHRTFRHYPQGIESADQSLRVQQLAALCWQFGFSTWQTSGLFNAFGVVVAHMSVWRDVQKRADSVRQSKGRPAMRVLGLDGVYARVAGQPQALTVAVDSGNVRLISLVEINEHSVAQALGQGTGHRSLGH